MNGADGKFPPGAVDGRGGLVFSIPRPERIHEIVTNPRGAGAARRAWQRVTRRRSIEAAEEPLPLRPETIDIGVKEKEQRISCGRVDRADEAAEADMSAAVRVAFHAVEVGVDVPRLAETERGRFTQHVGGLRCGVEGRKPANAWLAVRSPELKRVRLSEPHHPAASDSPNASGENSAGAGTSKRQYGSATLRSIRWSSRSRSSRYARCHGRKPGSPCASALEISRCISRNLVNTPRPAPLSVAKAETIRLRSAGGEEVDVLSHSDHQRRDREHGPAGHIADFDCGVPVRDARTTEPPAQSHPHRGAINRKRQRQLILRRAWSGGVKHYLSAGGGVLIPKSHSDRRCGGPRIYKADLRRTRCPSEVVRRRIGVAFDADRGSHSASEDVLQYPMPPSCLILTK